LNILKPRSWLVINELTVKTKLDYQISYKEIHADLPCDPTATYKGEWIDWNVFLGKNIA